MIFNTSATHALRALAHLAAGEGADATLGRDLAGEVGVPAQYLSKVLAMLARTGVLTATRGARGGYRLARPAAEITLLEIVEPFEGKRIRPGCLLGLDRPCRDDGACSAHAAWGEMKAAFLGFLERTTLADIRGGALPPAHFAGAARASRTAPGTRGRTRRRSSR